MADYTKRETYLLRITYTLPTPTNMIELDKARLGIAADFRAHHDGREPDWHNDLLIDSDDDQLTMSFEVGLERVVESPWKVGDPDPTPYTANANYCTAIFSDGGYVCTWPKAGVGNHPAWHVAGDGSTIAAVWPVEVSDPSEKVQA